MMYRKGIGPVVAIAMLLIVATVGVVGFQNWFDDYSSKTFVDVESKSNTAIDKNLNIEIIEGNSLFIKNDIGDNLSVTILKIEDNICNLSNLSLGMNEIDISDCLNNTGSVVDVVLISKSNVLVKTLFVKSLSAVNSCTDPDLIAENIKLGIDILGVVGTYSGGIIDNDGDGYYSLNDCNDSDLGIGFAVDGTCDGDGDGYIDFSAGGSDSCDNNLNSDCKNITDGLIRHYNFEDNTNDYFGIADGVAYNGLSYTDCKFSRCANFDGSNDYVLVNDNLMPQNKNVTFSFWLYSHNLQGYTTFSSTNPKSIISSNGATLDNVIRLKGSEVQINMDEGSAQWFSCLTGQWELKENYWHHLVVSILTDGFKIYIDNQLLSDCSHSKIWNNVSSYHLGTNYDHSQRFYDGLLDNLKVYNRSLEVWEIDVLYNE